MVAPENDPIELLNNPTHPMYKIDPETELMWQNIMAESREETIETKNNLHTPAFQNPATTDQRPPHPGSGSMIVGNGNIQPFFVQQSQVEEQHPFSHYETVNPKFSNGENFQLSGYNRTTANGLSQVPQSMGQNGLSVELQPGYGQLPQTYQSSLITTHHGNQGIPHSQIYGGWNERGMESSQSPHPRGTALNQQQYSTRGLQSYQEPVSTMMGFNQTKIHSGMNHSIGSQGSSGSLSPTSFSSTAQRLPSLNQPISRPIFESAKRTFSDFNETSQKVATVTGGSSSPGFSRSQSSGLTQALTPLSALGTPSPGYPSNIPIQQPVARPGKNPASQILSTRSPGSVSATPGTLPSQQNSPSAAFPSQHSGSSEFSGPKASTDIQSLHSTSTLQEQVPVLDRQHILTERELESIRPGYSAGYCSLDEFVSEPREWQKKYMSAYGSRNVFRRRVKVSSQESASLETLRAQERSWNEEKEREFDQRRGWEQGRVDEFGIRKLPFAYTSQHRCEHADHNDRWHWSARILIPLIDSLTNQERRCNENETNGKEKEGQEEKVVGVAVANGSAPEMTQEVKEYLPQDIEYDSGQHDMDNDYVNGCRLGENDKAPDQIGATDAYFHQSSQNNEHDSGRDSINTGDVFGWDKDEAEHVPENAGEAEEQINERFQDNQSDRGQDNTEIDSESILIDPNVIGDDYLGSHVW
ncbi:hypothetical protein GLAREA_07963 [Glarea lozoyensis ATCC 20868]|uniref:Uncharacterized protein n=1 Tax=Glarea lozoyensis (strain ATCC 20868 / MF5171) TaxID=1116229 RepID=S3DBS7_GLAL2|nr:uncharacterized protein GLAREA_07963 [Glarea lozoyensis ATCC 20868]EPE24113.1 hypothetical protein GLAREA_07963 [Glarea lozoyensis ATCC 20868]